MRMPRFLHLVAPAMLIAGCGGTDTATPSSTTVAATITASSTAPATPSIPTTTVPTTTAPATTVQSTEIPIPDPAVVIDETGRRMLEVPAGATPNIDGSLEEEAWASAVTTYMDDGTVLLWLRAGGDLYLGVRGDTMGSVNLLVAGDDRIRVLHSSAALGSAVYEARPDGVWHLTRDFEWCCRNPSDREEADLLWDDEGWTATIGPAGHRGEVEFRVALHTGDLRVAVSLVDAAGRAAVWPQGLHPDAVESLYGIRLAEETFMVETWVSVAPA